jgi:hypothetical protein
MLTCIPHTGSVAVVAASFTWFLQAVAAYARKARRRRELVTTLTLERAIAAAASAGDRSQPVRG